MAATSITAAMADSMATCVVAAPHSIAAPPLVAPVLAATALRTAATTAVAALPTGRLSGTGLQTVAERRALLAAKASAGPIAGTAQERALPADLRRLAAALAERAALAAAVILPVVHIASHPVAARVASPVVGVVAASTAAGVDRTAVVGIAKPGSL